VKSFWKAYGVGKASSSLKWELRYILPTLGFVETPSRRLWSHISDNWAKWEASVRAAALRVADHMGKSRKSLVQMQSQHQVVA
jgi:hypothetical protein